jgi:hypothetical protein
MSMRKVVALMLLTVAPAYGQSNLVPSVRASPPTSAPASSSVPQTPSDAAGTLIQGANQTQERARDAVNAGTDIREVLGKKPDARLKGFMEKANNWGDAVGAVVDGAEIYREYGMEGMKVFGAVEGSQFVVDKAVDMFGGPLAPAWRLGRQAGELVRQIPWNGQTIEDRVTDLWFNNIHGARADEEFERNTSGEAIERHRQKLREQRASQFQTLSRTNEAAAASRTPDSTYEAPSSDQGRFASDMMLMLTPAMISARQAQQRPAPAPQVPYAQPPSTGRTTQSGYLYDTRGYNNGRTVGTGSTSSTSDSGRSYSGGYSDCGRCHGCGCK